MMNIKPFSVKCTKISESSKLHNFQYRLLLNKIFINDTLFKWHIVESENCDICKLPIKQDIPLMLYHCTIAQTVWKFIQNNTGDLDNCLTWSLEIIMSNLVHPKAKHVVNKLVLIAKQFIFAKKCLQEPITIDSLMYDIALMYKIENLTVNSNIRKL